MKCGDAVALAPHAGKYFPKAIKSLGEPFRRAGDPSLGAFRCLMLFIAPHPVIERGANTAFQEFQILAPFVVCEGRFEAPAEKSGMGRAMSVTARTTEEQIVVPRLLR
ncbi:hypothetical protein [Fimbriiglobus ruber]|uniref:Uncharacterized protein n=1 Tax=Fimbriiglobus ruber TaxID=1908690 RepID=A0A225D129_9BACT|nr:hypothetical protein [Fimbriiglobus ruber]OWK35310.1 hypothetical protein FRUB_09471 [Fimbriiglobus ruber]